MPRKKHEQPQAGGAPPTEPKRITPVDIQQKEFRLAFRGYNERDVDVFLDEVTEEVARLHAENKRLREDLETRTTVRGDTRIAADADALIRGAREEAATILAEAREQAASFGAPATASRPPAGEAPASRAALGRLVAREREFLQRLAGLIQDHAKAVKDDLTEARSHRRPAEDAGLERPAEPSAWAPSGAGETRGFVETSGPATGGPPGPDSMRRSGEALVVEPARPAQPDRPAGPAEPAGPEQPSTEPWDDSLDSGAGGSSSSEASSGTAVAQLDPAVHGEASVLQGEAPSAAGGAEAAPAAGEALEAIWSEAPADEDEGEDEEVLPREAGPDTGEGDLGQHLLELTDQGVVVDISAEDGAPGGPITVGDEPPGAKAPGRSRNDADASLDPHPGRAESRTNVVDGQAERTDAPEIAGSVARSIPGAGAVFGPANEAKPSIRWHGFQETGPGRDDDDSQQERTVRELFWGED